MGNNVKLTWHTEKRRLGDLIEWDKNPRQLKEHDAEHLKKSLDNFGVADPLIINTDNRIIGGHMRRRIMLQSGYKPDDLVDVRVPERELTEREAEELAIRLNKNTGDWDFDALANNFELDDLLDWGFDKGELDLDLWADDAPEDVEPQIDKAEELREKWGVETGQLWQLGEHRLVCGDCTDKAVVEKVMQGEQIDLILTDPPYGIDVVGNNGSIGGGTRQAPTTKFTKVIGDEKEFDPRFLLEYGLPTFIWGGNYFAHLLPRGGRWFVWDKNRPEGLSLSDCELAWSNINGVKVQKFKSTWDGYHVEGEKSGRVHPNQKPIKLISDILSELTKDSQTVADFFLGSGTTLIACERLGRKCRAVEISPAYVAVAIQRWVDVTGGTPELVEPVIQV